MAMAGRAFVGRAADRALAADHFAEGGVGASLVYVDGPAGIGKTAFTEAVGADWSDAGGTVRWSRCWDGPGTPPLWPWAQLLDAEVGSSRSAVASRDPGSVDGRSADLARFEQFTAILEGLLQVQAAEPTLFVIEDIHWADEATLDCLHFATRDPRARDIRVIVTSRSPDAGLHESASLLAEIAHQAERVTLSGLDRDDVAELAAQYDAPESADIVFERTSGHPLYATELLRLGAAGVSIDDRNAVPQTVGAVIRRHLDVLGPSVKRILQLAAIQGQFFDPVLVGAAGDVAPGELAAMLTDARRFELVQHRHGSWMFVHALIGDALLADLPAVRREQDHLATADAIEQHRGADGDDLVGTICSHLRLAGHACPPERLLRAARRAAVRAREQLAWASEAEFFAIAADAVRAHSDVDEAQLIDVLIDQCRAEKAGRLLDAARATAVSAAQIVRRLDDPIRLARVALMYPPDSEGIEIDEIHDPEQVQIRIEALESLPERETELRIQLQASLALSLYWETPTGDRAESHHRSAARRDELTRSALDAARELNDPNVLAVALDARIHATWGPETVAERPRLAEELYDVALELGDARRVLVARIWRIAELLETARLDEADREIEAFEADAERINDRVGRWTALRWRSNRAFMAGDLPAAESLAGEALGLAVDVLPEHVSMSFYVTMLGPIHYVSGLLGDDLDVVSSIADESPDVPAWRVGIATAMSETGSLDEAGRQLRLLAADDFAMLPRDLNFFGAMIMLSLTCLNVGDAEVAAAIRPYLEVRAGRYAIHGTGYTSYGPVDLSIAQTAHAAGDHEAARRYYESAIELGDRVGTPYTLAARMHFGMLMMQTDPSHARSLLDDARTGFEAIDAPVMAARCVARIAELDAASTVALRARGSEWTLHRHGAEPVVLGDLKGMRALRELLLHPHQSLHALTLTRVIEGTTESVVSDDGYLPAHLDSQAISEYRTRLEDLRNELDRADRRGDVQRSERLQSEIDAVTDALLGAEGFGGRSATDVSNADRARVNITKHVKRSIDRVATIDQALGHHLRVSVSTGMHCVYAPAVNAEVRWIG